MSKVIVAIDPGKWHCGVAVGRDVSPRYFELVSAHTVRIPKGSALRAARLADIVWGHCSEYLFTEDHVSFVAEGQQSYPGGSGKEDDLDALRETNDAIETRIRHVVAFDRAPTFRRVRPHAWKGNVGKTIHHARIYRALGRAELAHLTGQPPADFPDTWDAVGLLLFAARRVGRGGTVLP